MGRLLASTVFCLALGCGRVGFDLGANDSGRDGNPDDDSVGDDDDSVADDDDDVADDDDDVADDDDDVAGDGGTDGDASMCASPCELVAPQCGCGAGEGCYLPTDGSPQACATAGGLPRGSACARDADCAAGLACNIFRAAPQGVCEPYCNDGSQCGGTECAAVILDGPAGGCSTPCDPRVLTGCPGALACRVETVYRHPSMAMMLVGACEPPAGLPLRADCAMTSSCAAGLACLNYKCEPICRVGRTDCAAGTCTGFDMAGAVGPLFVDGERLGACLE